MVRLSLLSLLLLSVGAHATALSGESCADGGCPANDADAELSNLMQGQGIRRHGESPARSKPWPRPPVPEQALLYVNSFTRYFNYEGKLNVTGSMVVATSMRGQSLNWQLSGADANCGYTPFPNGPISNDCGIHIHVGTDCTSDAGAHYFDTPTDPWTAVHYDTKGCYTQDKGVAVKTGFKSNDDIIGHAMIVHDLSGSRIACGIIGPPVETQLVVKSFKRYFNYDGPLDVSGTMIVGTYEQAQYLEWNLHGQDANCGCTNYPVDSNDCGIHIHVGTSCDEDAGAHYFATGTDPWKAVHYSTEKGCSSSTGVKVATDLCKDDILGRAMIVHNIAGERIACGIIEEGTLGGVCYRSQCGCPPFTHAPPWCSESSYIHAPWCNANKDQCEGGCSGKWCTR